MNRVWKHIVIWISTILIVLIVVHAVLVAITGKQLRSAYAAVAAAGRPTKAEEIIPKPVQEADNAAPLYKKVFALLDVLEPEDWYDVHAGLTETNAPAELDLSAARAFIVSEDASRALRLVEEAVGKKACRFERDYTAGAAMLLPECGSIRSVTRLVQIRALVEAHGGDGAAAARTLVLGLKTAEAVADDPILISQLVRISQIALMLATAETVFETVTVPDEAVAGLAAQLRQMKGRDGFLRSMDGERLLMGEWGFGLFEGGGDRETLASLASETGVGPARFYGSRLLRPLLQADHALYMRLMLRMTEQGARPPHKAKWDIDFEKEIPRYCILTRLILPALNSAADSAAAGEARMEVADAVIALVRHKALHGAYPASPGALDKDLLPAWPMDLFSGKPLVYRPFGETVMVYSIGINRTDDGGQKSGDRREGDIVWAIGGGGK